MKTFLQIIILFFAFTLTCKAQYQTFEDLDYVGDNRNYHKLDITVPSGLSEPAPLAIYIHGGGWRIGNKGGGAGFADDLLRKGFILADVNYRLSGDSIFPAQIFDCKAAVRWLKSQAGKYMIDTNRIGVIGASAGAHLAMMLGFTADDAELEGLHLGSAGHSSKVHAIVDFYGPSDFDYFNGYYPAHCPSQGDINSPLSPITLLLGCPPKDCPDKSTLASPITHLDPTDTPVLIYQGINDCIVPPIQSTIVDSALKENNIYSELVELDDGHGFRPNNEQKLRIYNFLNMVFDGTSSAGWQQNSAGNISIAPNPFSESAVIRYRLEQPGYVSLVVYDIFGNEAAGLVNEYKETGGYSITLGASNLADGVYFYRIRIGDISQSGKIIVAK